MVNRLIDCRTFRDDLLSKPRKNESLVARVRFYYPTRHSFARYHVTSFLPSFPFPRPFQLSSSAITIKDCLPFETRFTTRLKKPEIAHSVKRKTVDRFISSLDLGYVFALMATVNYSDIE